MEKFRKLEDNKQQLIINNAMQVFAENGYKKAYMSEIAEKCELTKPMLFYYFGSKMKLYLFLVDYAYGKVQMSITTFEDDIDNDFFNYLLYVTERKLEVLHTCPYLMRFLSGYYFETEPEIEATKIEYANDIANAKHHLGLDDLDTSKFKSSVDPKLVFEMLGKWTEGYLSALEKPSSNMTNQALVTAYVEMGKEFKSMIDMLRTNFYKEQYL